MEGRRGNGFAGSRRNPLVVHGFSAPWRQGLFLFPCVERAETAVIVVAQALEVVEGYHFQVNPGKSVRQLLANAFEDAHARELLDALGKCLLPSLSLLFSVWQR